MDIKMIYMIHGSELNKWGCVVQQIQKLFGETNSFQILWDSKNVYKK